MTQILSMIQFRILNSLKCDYKICIVIKEQVVNSLNTVIIKGTFKKLKKRVKICQNFNNNLAS